MLTERGGATRLSQLWSKFYNCFSPPSSAFDMVALWKDISSSLLLCGSNLLYENCLFCEVGGGYRKAAENNHSWSLDRSIASKKLTAMFQILLQSRCSSQQSYPDKISMTSKDMKSLNVKSGLNPYLYLCHYCQTAFIRQNSVHLLFSCQLQSSNKFCIHGPRIPFLPSTTTGCSVLVQCDTIGIICKAWSSKTLTPGTATIHRSFISSKY